MTIESVKAKVMAMLAKAGDPAASEAKALSAMTMARRLMDKHGIAEADLENASGDDFVERSWRGRQTKKHGVVFHPVDRLLSGAIAKFAGVRRWYKRPPGTEEAHVVFFGLEADVALAEWLRATLVSQFDRDWENYCLIDRKNKALSKVKESRIGFANGFASAINERFDDWLYRSKDALDGYDNALVLKKQDIIQDEMARRGIHLRQTIYTGAAVTAGISAGAGYNAGKAAQIAQGVNSGRPQIMLPK